MRLPPTAAITALSLLFATACVEDDGALTDAELRASVEAMIVAGRGEALGAEVVEISTGVTLGERWQAAAEELARFYETQMPCSTVARVGAVITVDFGTLDDPCVYAGRTWAGVQVMEVVGADAGRLDVQHTWEGITDGFTTLDGDVDVGWDFAAGTRRVQHADTWSSPLGTVETTGDRTQRLLEPALGAPGGIVVDGVRAWIWKDEPWELTIEGVEMRPQDPVPQAGGGTLVHPSGKALDIAFERQDASTIRVRLASGAREAAFDVRLTGVEAVD